MPNELLAVLAAAGVLAVTYLVHSTLAIGGVWCAVRISRPRSQALVEQLWKAAAVVGVLTATVQCALGVGGFDLALGVPGSRSDESDRRQAAAVIAGTAAAAAQLHLTADRPVATDAAAENAMIAAEPPLISIDESIGVAVVEDALAIDEVTAAAARSLPALSDAGWQDPDIGAVVSFADAQDLAEPRSTARGEPDATAARTPPRTVAVLVVVSLGAFGLVCVIGGGVRLIVQSVAFRRRLSPLRDIENGPTRRELDALLRRNRVRRRVALQESNAFREPFACGLLHWRIVVPTDIARRLRREELRALLAHEMAHLVRGDAAWLWIGRMLCSCVAFQPLNFLARRRWQRAEECLCDDWAVRSGASAVALARCLTRVAEWRQGCTAVLGLAVGGTRPSLTDRVERLVGARNGDDRWTGSPRRCVLRAALILAAFALAWYAPRASLPAADAVAGTGEPDAGAADISEADVRSELTALDSELQSLERQMQRVSELLVRVPLSPEEEQIAQRLRRRAESLARHRAELTGRAHLLSDE